MYALLYNKYYMNNIYQYIYNIYIIYTIYYEFYFLLKLLKKEIPKKFKLIK